MQSSDQTIANEIKALTDLIRHHNFCYFQKNAAEISDYAYDQLVERLIQLEKTYPHLKEPHSPTETIGEKPSYRSPLVHHTLPMLSLAKTYSEAEIVQFVTKVKKIAPDLSISFICEPKIDGVALCIRYESGKLVAIVTRGDGTAGDDITQRALQCMQLPTVIEDAPFASFEVRGEAFMPKASFKAFNDKRKKEGKPLWANPRNITAGTLNALDGRLVEDRQLAFYGYSLYTPERFLATHQEALAWLVKWGFSTLPIYKVCKDVSAIMNYIHYWAKHKNELPVSIDGIVVKVNELDQQQLLGATAKAPRWAIAYKYQPETAHSTLENITFQVGRSGVVTPVAHFKPVVLAGTSVSRASLYNAEELARRAFHVGDTILIEKGGDIIPKIVGIDLAHRKAAQQPILFPQSCPACATPLYRAAGEAIYYCPNKQRCLPQLKGLLSHFVQRKAMAIDAIGPKTIDALWEAKLVQTAADLYKLRYEDVIPLAGFQALSARKLLANIQSSKARPFDKVLFALGIKHVGETLAKTLALYFACMERLQQATLSELLAIPTIGATIAQHIVAYFQDPDQQALLADLQSAGLQFSLQQQAIAELPLSAKKIVVSGTFHYFTREALMHCIEQAGATLVTSVSAKVDYVVAGQKAGPAKLAKAKALAIPILREQDFMNLIRYESLSCI
ncbi:MAG: NAD-dependent DNA ligase LigA [Candidatus Cardinium sp.]|nr:NAD-dependent DNA ligase LigA [Candidatus Cardinium sp.]